LLTIRKENPSDRSRRGWALPDTPVTPFAFPLAFSLFLFSHLRAPAEINLRKTEIEIEGMLQTISDVAIPHPAVKQTIDRGLRCVIRRPDMLRTGLLGTSGHCSPSLSLDVDECPTFTAWHCSNKI